MAEIEVHQADITELEVDAIANAANTELRHGGGVAGAISRAGGPSVQAESHQRAPIGLGEAVETSAGEMPCRWVIHVGGFPLEEAAMIEVEEVRRHLDGQSGLERVVFAVRGGEAEAAFRAAMNRER